MKRWMFSLLFACSIAVGFMITVNAEPDPALDALPGQLIIDLGEQWADTEFSLETDVGPYPGKIVVSSEASLLWNLDKANYIGSPTLVPYLSLHQFHPYRLLLILFRILCCKIRSPTQFPYRIFFFFFQDCLFAAVFCCISPKNANKGELLTNPLVFAMILLQTDVRIRLPDRVSYRERAVGTQPHLRSLFTISKPIGVDSYIQNQYW